MEYIRARIAYLLDGATRVCSVVNEARAMTASAYDAMFDVYVVAAGACYDSLLLARGCAIYTHATLNLHASASEALLHT